MGGPSSRSPGADGKSFVKAAEVLAPEVLDDLRRRLFAAVRRTCPARLGAQMEDIVQTLLTRRVVSQGRGEGKPAYPSTYPMKAA